MCANYRQQFYHITNSLIQPLCSHAIGGEHLNAYLFLPLTLIFLSSAKYGCGLWVECILCMKKSSGSDPGIFGYEIQTENLQSHIFETLSR